MGSGEPGSGRPTVDKPWALHNNVAYYKRLLVSGGRGDDSIVGGAGDDRLVGGSGRDRVIGDDPGCNWVDSHNCECASISGENIEASGGSTCSADTRNPGEGHVDFCFARSTHW